MHKDQFLEEVRCHHHRQDLHHQTRCLGARKGVRACLAAPPLCMSAEAYAAMGLSTHSFHGTGPDMARFMGSAGLPFVENDARELGHWLRDKNAPQHQQDPRMVPGAPSRGQAPGAPVARGAMSLHYTSGPNRLGERAAQLSVRVRLIEAVRAALTRHGGPWWTIPASLESWDILVPPEAAARMAGRVRPAGA